MRCGWLPSEEWEPWDEKNPAVPPIVGDVPYPLRVCPGWVVRQPAVVEACQAHASFKQGCFESFHPSAANSLCEAVLVVEQSFNRYEAYRIKERERMRREKGDG